MPYQTCQEATKGIFGASVIEKSFSNMQTAIFRKINLDLQRLILNIKEYYMDRLAGIVVFGSASRGDLTTTSDIDLLIVLYECHKTLKMRIEEFYQAIGDYLEDNFDLFLSPIIVTIQEMQRFHPIYLGIFKDFTILYEKDQCVQNLYEYIQTLKKENKIKDLNLNGNIYWKIELCEKD